MAWAYRFSLPIVNFDATGTTHTTVSETAATAYVVGDLVVLAVSYVKASDTTVSIADNLGNTYTEISGAHIFSATDNNIGARIFYCFVTTAGTATITATYGAASTYTGIFASVYNGISALDGASSDKRTGSGTAGTDTLTSNAYTVSAAPAMCWAVGMDANITNGDDMTAGTGATRRLAGKKSNGLATFIATEDENVSATGSNTATFSLAQTGSAYHCVQVVFTEGSVAAPNIYVANPNRGTFQSMNLR